MKTIVNYTVIDSDVLIKLDSLLIYLSKLDVVRQKELHLLYSQLLLLREKALKEK